MSILEVQGVEGGYAAHDMILKGVSLAVAQDEMVAILGPNGAGKSTLLKTVAGVLHPRAGAIRFDGASIAGLSPREISRRGAVFVPQEGNIFPSMSIEENLEIGAWVDRRHTRRRIAAVLERIPLLAERRRRPARTLSGGQRQMLAMGMALMVEPRLMLLDEPTAGLSPVAAADLLSMARGLTREGVTVVIVEQNALQALGVADRAYVLVDGRNSIEAPCADLLADPKFRELFLGLHDEDEEEPQQD